VGAASPTVVAGASDLVREVIELSGLLPVLDLIDPATA
jgi:hypothetical protein